jgi:hypothetical protein
MELEFIGTCVRLEANDLYAYDDSERRITYRTFARHLGRDAIRELNERFGGRPLSQDHCVSFGRGKWKGRPCVCLHHSRIHHLWYLPGKRKTIRRSRLSNLAMVAGGEEHVRRVILDGTVRNWVGFGWVDEGPPTERQRQDLHHVID